jgi:hypothetical protein
MTKLGGELGDRSSVELWRRATALSARRRGASTETRSIALSAAIAASA